VKTPACEELFMHVNILHIPKNFFDSVAKAAKFGLSKKWLFQPFLSL
jgi:hypothetical protein